MGVAEHQIGADSFPCDDVLPGEPCKEPHLLSLLQGTSSLVPHSLPQQFIREAECIHVLYHFVAV